MFHISPLLNTAKVEKVIVRVILFDHEKRYCSNGGHKNLRWIYMNCGCTIHSKMHFTCIMHKMEHLGVAKYIQKLKYLDYMHPQYVN